MPDLFLSTPAAEPLWFDSGWPPALADLTGYAGFVFYLDPGDHRRPDPTKAQLDAYLAAGLDLAMLWQAGKVDIAAGGFDLGAAHAAAANTDADLKGAGGWEPILYACDANRTFAQVEAYYRGVLSVPGRPVGAYGGGDLIDQLHDQLGLRYFMEAAAKAWDHALDYVSPHSQFWQRDPNVPVGNSAVDQVVQLGPYPTRRNPVPGAVFYPPADRTSQWYGPANATVAPNKILWHTTETAGGWPTYSALGVDGANCPNLTYNPWLHQWHQHLPLNGTSRALQNATGYSTNRQGTVQVEISCTNGWNATAVAQGKAVWNLDDQALHDLADFSRFMADQWAVPLTTGVAWPAYPTAPVRLTPAQFTGYRGQLGHMHAPYQDHGDPGGLAVPRILTLATGGTTQGANDMPLDDATKTWLKENIGPGTVIHEAGDQPMWAVALQARDDGAAVKGQVFGPWPFQRFDGSTGSATLVDYIRGIDAICNSVLGLADRPGADSDNVYGHVLSLRAELRALAAKAAEPVDVDTLAAELVAELAPLLPTSVDTAAVAAAIAANLAARLVTTPPA